MGDRSPPRCEPSGSKHPKMRFALKLQPVGQNSRALSWPKAEWRLEHTKRDVTA